MRVEAETAIAPKLLGEGIDVTENLKGQKVVSLEKGAITDDYIGSISFEKIVIPEGSKIIFNGGNANG